MSRNKDAGKPGLDDGQQAGDEAFLSRWSRRKSEARQHDNPPTLATDEATVDAPADAADAQLPTDADMPDLDSLTEDSDYRGFMSPKVSEELRKMALRKLFHASAFNVRDGLDDYDDDFASFTKLGDVITADMKHQAQRIAEKMGEQPEVAESPDVPGVTAQASATEPHESDEPAAEGPEEESPALASEGSVPHKNEDIT